MTIPNTSRRSTEHEVMDDFDLQGPELQSTLRDIDRINKWLGGNRLTLKGIAELLKDQPTDRPVQITDVGCGNGSMLREVARWGRSKGYKFHLKGIDANLHAIEIARTLSASLPEITYSTTNIFSQEFEEQQTDIFLCTLTLHHFKDEQIRKILKRLCRNSRMGIVINDLHRSRLAYFLFQAFCGIFIRNEIARKDGLISILRGFKKKDLRKLAALIPSHQQEIRWKWAFRYRWIIKKSISHEC